MSSAGQPVKYGSVRYVVFCQYVIQNVTNGAMSLIDVIDGLNVISFPIDFRIFAVVSLDDAHGDFNFIAELSSSDRRLEVSTPNVYVPVQPMRRSNIAVQLPPIEVKEPIELTLTLRADGVVFHQEPFAISALRNVSQRQRV